MKQPLVIGAGGTIGNALHQRIGGAAFTRADFDLATPPDQWPTLPEADVAFLCTAITKLDECERAPEISRIVNVVHMKTLIERLQAHGTFVVFLSSNQVFDGSVPYRKAGEVTCPINQYGAQKAELESWLLARSDPAAVLRLTKVLSGKLPMLEHWETALAKGEAVEAFDDLLFAPLPIACALDALVQIGNEKRAGISQLSGATDISYYYIAQKLAATMGVPASRIIPASARDKGILPQFLPKHGTLESSAFDGIIVPDPEQAIL